MHSMPVLLCKAALCSVIRHDVMLRRTLLLLDNLQYVIYVVLWNVMPRYVMLCYIALSFGVLRHVASCMCYANLGLSSALCLSSVGL